MTQPAVRAVLWDLDGTVLDSRQAHWQAWRTFSEQHGRPMTFEYFSDTFGYRNEIILRRHFGADLTDAQVQAFSHAKEVLYRQLLTASGAQPLPGVVDWLRWAEAQGWRQALASMAPRANIDVTLAGLQLPVRFQAIVSAEDVRHGKPDPEVFLLAARRLDVPPERCTVIEDSPQGVAAARRAGMCSIGVGPLADTLDADLVLPTLAAAPPATLALRPMCSREAAR